MTDFISKLADALVELNNASPRLPRKEQIEEVLRASLPETRHHHWVTWGMDWGRTPSETVMVKWSSQDGMLDWSPITQEQLVQAADDICAASKEDDEAKSEWDKRLERHTAFVYVKALERLRACGGEIPDERPSSTACTCTTPVCGCGVDKS